MSAWQSEKPCKTTILRPTNEVESTFFIVPTIKVLLGFVRIFRTLTPTIGTTHTTLESPLNSGTSSASKKLIYRFSTACVRL